MSSSPRLTLADFVEKFFALKDNPQANALLVALTLAFGCWLIPRNNLPTKAEALVKARHSGGRGVVVRTSQNSRGAFGLDVMDRDNRLVQQAFWAYYYPIAVAADTANQLPYEASNRLALAAYARVGDSLVKKPGTLFVQVKRGNTSRTFYFRNPYP